MVRTTRHKRRPSPDHQTGNLIIDGLKRQIAELGEPELISPDVATPRQPRPVPRIPPKGGWPDDEGWQAEADVYQGMSGEDPQC